MSAGRCGDGYAPIDDCAVLDDSRADAFLGLRWNDRLVAVPGSRLVPSGIGPPRP